MKRCLFALKMLLLGSAGLTLTSNAFAQNLGFDWVRKFDTLSTSRSVAIDPANKVYAAGIINGMPHLVKFDEQGTVVWTKTVVEIISPGAVAEVSSVQADQFGNIYTAGYFNNKVYFNNQADSLTAIGTLATSLNGYVAKFDTAGNFVWAKQFGAGARQAYAADVTIDNWGNLTVLGRYIGTGDFNPGTDTFTLSNGSTNTSLHNIYITKLNNAGDFIWAKQFQGSAGVSNCFAIEADKWGDLVIAGSFRNTMDFDPGPGFAYKQAPSGVDGYIVKLDSAGNFNWVKHIQAMSYTSSSAREIYDIALDSLGAVYATGYFSNSVILDPNIATPATTAVNGFDAMIFKCDSAGVYEWDVIYGGYASDIGRSILLDEFNNVYSSGTFSDSIDFDPGAGTHFLYTDNNANSYFADIYYSKLTSTGDFIWAKAMGGKRLDQVDAIALDASNNLYSVGVFYSDSVDFDPNPNSTHMEYLIPPPNPAFPTFTANEMFVHKMSCADTSSSVLDIDACVQYIFNNETFTTSGTYVRVLRGHYGCDSTVTLNLNIIDDLNVFITVNGFELGTTSTFSTYQWLLNGAVITGATNTTYTVNANGDYQVVVTNDQGCTDTSEVYIVNNVSIDELDKLASQIKVYPNPSDHIVHVNSPVSVSLQLTSIDGRILMNKENAKAITVKELADGVYFLRIMDKDNRLIKVEKIVKQ